MTNLLLTSMVAPIAGSGERGTWIAVPDLLGRMSNGVKTNKKDATIEDFVSVPDVWAQVHLFERALSKEDHPFHAEAQKRWRGLLGLFALKGELDLDIRVHTVDIKQISKSSGADQQATRFARLVHELAPQVTSRLTTDQTWNQIGVAFLGDVPFALIVPNTLICPVRNWPDKPLAANTPWWNGHELNDPSDERFSLQPERLFTLKEYCENLSATLAGVNESDKCDSDLLNDIIRELGSFVSALGPRSDKKSKFINKPASTENLTFPPDGKHKIYGTLKNIVVNTPPIVGGQTQSLCDVRDEVSGQIKGAVVYDRALTKDSNDFGIVPANFRVWGANTVDDLNNRPDGLDALEKQMNADGYILVTPDRIFTPKLVALKDKAGDEAKVKENPVGFEGYVLPVTPLALILFSPEELKHSLTFDGETKTVTMSIPMRDGNTCKLRRAFQTVEQELPDALSVWPNFRHSNWRWNFLSFRGTLGSQISLRMIVSASEIARILGVSGTPLNESVGAIQQGSAATGRRLSLNKDSKPLIHELYHATNAVEAVYCDYVAKEPRGFVPSENREPAGLVLFPPASDLDLDPDLGIRVGIDFGTTNSTVYFGESTGALHPVVFEGRLLTPFASGDDDADQDRGFEEFVPFTDSASPFLTVLWDRRNESSDGVRDPIWSGVIYFANTTSRSITANRVNRFAMGFKWDNSETGKANTFLFLANVVLMTMAEVAAKQVDWNRIHWNFSYPGEVFSEFKANAFEEGCQQVLDSILGNQSVPSDRFRMENESKAAAYYFCTAGEANFSDRTITLDIGGGTTDISMWNGTNLVWHGSLKFAGEQMPIEYFAHNTGLLRKLLGADAKGGASSLQGLFQTLRVIEENKGHKITLKRLLEFVVNSELFKSKLESELKLLDSGDGDHFVASAVIALSGILFFVGRIVGRAIAMGMFESAGGGEMDFSIYLGGKGSQIYKTLLAKRNAPTQLKKLYKDLPRIFLNAAGLTGENVEAELHFSNKPKEEVAYGLVVPPEVRLDASTKPFPSPLGAEVTIDGNAVDSVRELAVLLARRPDGIKLTEVPGMGAFLDDLESVAKIYLASANDSVDDEEDTDEDDAEDAGSDLELRDDLNRKLAKSMNNYFIPFTQGTPSKRDHSQPDFVLEPPFIVGLRKLLLMVAKHEIEVGRDD